MKQWIYVNKVHKHKQLTKQKIPKIFEIFNSFIKCFEAVTEIL